MVRRSVFQELTDEEPVVGASPQPEVELPVEESYQLFVDLIEDFVLQSFMVSISLRTTTHRLTIISQPTIKNPLCAQKLPNKKR